MVFYSRIIIVVLVLGAFLIGIYAEKLVFWLVLFAWGGLGAAFGPPLLLSLFWQGTTRAGVAAGFISGTLAIIIWNQTPALKNLMYELPPAFLISTVFTVLFSLRKAK